MPELLAALDVGTTTVTACVFAPGGDLLSRASAPVRTQTPQPGHVEQDAEAVAGAARRMLRVALAKAGRHAHDLAALGMTSQRTSLVVWDRRTGKALTPLIVWSDLRGAGRAAELQQAGFPIAPQQAAAKLEQALAGVDGSAELALGNIDSFVIWKLSGGAAHVTDRSQAWPLGYLDLMSFGWNEALIAHQGLDAAMFPQLVDTWGPMATTTRQALGAAVPITADVADQQAALIGHAAENAGEAKVTFGTSGTLNVSTGAQFTYLGGPLPPFVLSSVGGQHRWCVEGMVISAGAALDWVRKTMRLGNHARFDHLASSVGDAGGAWFLPALQGLGAPHGDLSRRGALGGLSLAVGPAEIARAAMEGLAYRTREAFEAIYAGAGLPQPGVLSVDGGLTASDAFLQIQADALGLPVRRHAHREATACGAAVAAGRGVGLLTEADTQGFARYDRSFEPDISSDEAQARYSAWKTAAYGG